MFWAADENGSARGESHLSIQKLRAFTSDPDPVLGQVLLLLDQRDFESHPPFVGGRNVDRLIRGEVEGVVSEESIGGKAEQGTQFPVYVREGRIDGRSLVRGFDQTNSCLNLGKSRWDGIRKKEEDKDGKASLT
jgi:hypothetical protein